jgi:hypothetical protein
MTRDQSLFDPSQSYFRDSNTKPNIRVLDTSCALRSASHPVLIERAFRRSGLPGITEIQPDWKRFEPELCAPQIGWLSLQAKRERP